MHETKSGSFPVAAVKVCETFPHAVCKLLRSHERSYEPGLNRLFLFSSTRGCHPGFSHDMPLSLSYVHKGAGETDCEILFHRWFLVRGRCCQPTGCSLCGLCCCFVTSQVLHIAVLFLCSDKCSSFCFITGVILFNQITLPWWDIFLVWQTVSLGKSPILPLSQQL